MKSFKLFILVLSQVIILVEVNAQDYKTSVEVISSGGGESIGGNYSNFGVLGETFVDYSVAGGNYNTSIGFMNSLQEGPTSLTKIINSKIIIYPNPVSNKLIIDIDEEIEKVILYDCFGKELFIDKFVFEIDVSMYPSGIYFLEVQIKGNLFRSKIVIE